MKKIIMRSLICSALIFASSVTTYSYAQDAATQNNPPSRAQQLMGDIAPKMAQLTDDVLYADI